MDKKAKTMLPILGLGMMAGAALGMAMKPHTQAVVKEKTGHAMKTVGETMENISDAMRGK